MKKHYLIIVSISLLFTWHGFTQNSIRESCGTDMSSLRQDLRTSTNTDNGDPICLRVRINRMVSKNGLNQEIGVTSSEATSAFNRLNESFAPYNIHFHDAGIQKVKAGNLYNCVTSTTIEPLLSENNIFTAINIYLFNEDNNADLGKSSFIIPAGGTHYIFLAGHNSSYQNTVNYSSKAIVHEMGHTFSLDHTHEGTICLPGFTENWELINGSNSHIAGDKITDTPADPYIAGNVDEYGNWTPTVVTHEYGGVTNSQTCTVEYNNPEDQQFIQCDPPEPIEDYTPDTHNYMSYTHPEAMSRFSCGQVEKMRDHILHSGLFDSIIVTNSCETIGQDCSENDTIASSMLASFSKVSDDPCLYKIDIPPSLTGCTEVLVDWNIPNLPVQNIDLSQNEVTIEYPENGNYNIEITFLKYGVSCGYASGIKNVNCLDDDDCISCNDLAHQIETSITPSAGCSISVTIPDLSNCYYGRVYWNHNFTSDLMVSGETMTYTYPTGGNYNIGILIYNQDGTICNKFVKKITPFCWKNKVSNIKIHPNPSKSNQEVSFDGIDYKEIIGIEVFDIYGNQKSTMKPRRNAFTIGRLNSGIYFVKFNTTYGTITKKLVIE